MKKNLLLISFFFLIFFSKITFSSYNLDNSLDCCLFATTTTLTHNCGYMIHKKCTFKFNQENTFDVMCARTTGIIATTVALNIISGGSCSPQALYTPIVAHNIVKCIDEYLNKSESSNFYPNTQKPKIKNMN